MTPLFDDDIAYALALTGPGETITINGRHAERLLRALAIAKAVDERTVGKEGTIREILDRADELLKDKP